MIDVFFQEILNLKWVIVTYVVATVAFYFLYAAITKKFAWKLGKIRTFGVVYNLERPFLIAFAVLICRLLFVIITAIRIKDTGLQTLIALILMTVVICFTDFKVKNLIKQVFTYVLIFGTLLLQSMLWHYYMEVERFWVAMAVCVFLGVFASIYAVYDAITSYNEFYGSDDKNRHKVSVFDHLKGSFRKEHSA